MFLSKVLLAILALCTEYNVLHKKSIAIHFINYLFVLHYRSCIGADCFGIVAMVTYWREQVKNLATYVYFIKHDKSLSHMDPLSNK